MLSVLTPTGHLGYVPIQPESFEIGVERRPDAIIADSGSNDIGPYPLGADKAHSPREWQRQDLEWMLLASRKLKVPMIIGSASDTGTDRGVDDFIAFIKDIAAKHHLAPFKLAAIYTEQKPVDIARHLPLEGLDGIEPLDEETLAGTQRIVGVLGPEPIMQALEDGADVIICGRSCDDAIYAAFAMFHGMPQSLSVLWGKTLECASLCAEPFMVNQSIMGFIDKEQVIFEPMHPGQRCTPHSLAGHALYERLNPFFLRGPGGSLDLMNCHYEAVDNRRARITGPRFIPDEQYAIKLEGAKYVGAQAIILLGIKDPIILQHLGEVIAFSRNRIKQAFKGIDFQLYFHPYGRGHRIDRVAYAPRDVGLLIETVAPTDEMAREIALMASRNVFFAEFGGQVATAGGAAQLFDEAVSIKPAYEWSVHHLLPVKEPGELFRYHQETVKGESAS
ncbi:MAG: acyclic terpene utilization AtuA family protein [Thermaerobacterales bacterium]